MRKTDELITLLQLEEPLSKEDRILAAKYILNYTKEKEKHKESNWIAYPSLWECANCKFWVDKYINLDFSFPDSYIKRFKWCPRCGSEMVFIKGSVGRDYESMED